MKKLLVLFGVLIVISGCSSSPTPTHQITQAPSERVYLYQNYLSDGSTVVFIRDKGLVGSGCYANIYIDGNLVSKLEIKEKAQFYVEAGDHILGSSIEGRGLCSFNNPRLETDVKLKANETKYFRVFTDNNGNIEIKPTTLY